MKMRPEHFVAIQLLLDHRFTDTTLAAIAEELGVQDRTLRKWRKDEAFEREYDAAFDRWKKDLEGVAFTHRRKRIEELVRLYEATPDVGVERWMDGTPRRVHINANAKAGLLKQIAIEVGDWAEKLEHAGPGGGPIGFAEMVANATERKALEAAQNGSQNGKQRVPN